MTNRIWAGIIFVAYAILLLICVIMDQCIFNNGHHPITNAAIPVIFLFGFIYCIIDVEGFDRVDAMSGVFWLVLVFSWSGPFYMLARIIGFKRLNVVEW